MLEDAEGAGTALSVCAVSPSFPCVASLGAAPFLLPHCRAVLVSHPPGSPSSGCHPRRATVLPRGGSQLVPPGLNGLQCSDIGLIPVFPCHSWLSSMPGPSCCDSRGVDLSGCCVHPLHRDLLSLWSRCAPLPGCLAGWHPMLQGRVVQEGDAR